jgi:hypothetical protein
MILIPLWIASKGKLKKHGLAIKKLIRTLPFFGFANP